MVADLSAGALATLMQGGTVEKPVFQVLGIKKIGSNDRYRLHISDGEQACSFAMLATQLNDMVEKGKLDTFAVFRAENHICNFVPPDKRILVILDLTVLSAGSVVGRELGNPKLTKPQATPAITPQLPPSKPFYAAPKLESAPKHQPQIFNKIEKSSSSTAPKSSTGPVTVPIVALTPYQNRWLIRARVTSKSAVRTWSNSRGEGKLFNFDLLDDTCDIRATCFNDQCDKFYNLIEINQIYYIGRGSLKPCDRRYNKSKSDYEMQFNNETTVERCLDDGGDDLPTVQYEFVPIAQLTQHETDSLIDVIGIVARCGDLQTIRSKTNNKEFQKRDLFIVDTSNTEVTLTLWNQQATDFDGSTNPVVSIKGARLSDFGGRSLSAINSSLLLVNPDFDETRILKKWFEESGRNSKVESISKSGGSGVFNANWKYLRHVELDKLGTGEKADYFTCKGTISYIKKENCLYKACPTESCNKKVISYNNEKYRCEKCNQEFDSFKWRLMIQANISDPTGSLWVTCFQETGEMILGKKSQELGDLMESDNVKFLNILESVNLKSFIFKLRSKEDTYNDEKRVKTTAVTVSPMNYIEYNQKLIADFNELVLAE